jgi:hypothetical protein
MPVDRRRGIRDRRVALRVPAVFAVKSQLRGGVQLNQAEDLGPGGISLRRLPDVPAPLGSPIALTFALPGGGPLLRASGLVVSDALTGTFRRTGVRFGRLPADVQQKIARFCAAQPPQYAEDDLQVSTG